MLFKNEDHPTGYENVRMGDHAASRDRWMSTMAYVVDAYCGEADEAHQDHHEYVERHGKRILSFSNVSPCFVTLVRCASIRNAEKLFADIAADRIWAQ